MENWEKLPSARFCNLYEVSSHGRIKRSLTSRGATAGTIRKLKTHPSGYLIAILSHENKQYRLLVHRLVAGAFLGDPSKGRKYVNHKNGVKTDNRLENLEYVSPSENSNHASKMGLLAFGERNSKAKISELDAMLIRESNEIARVLAARYGVNKSTIYRIKWGNNWAHQLMKS